MSEMVLQTRGLIKTYGQTNAVDHVNMNLKKGEVYGFIGQNGAGKTTLIRMISSLINPTGGEIELFGSSRPQDLADARKRMGCIIEGPAFYPKLSATENLEYYRIQRGIADKEAVHKALTMVQLTDTGKKSFSQFSLGMKQRLGLALAVMGKPDFLILDEPINGLDPMGIVEFREIIRKLQHEHGMTVLISSHILSELAQIATSYGIIHQGKLLQELTHKELESATKRSIRLCVDDAAKAAVVLQEKLNTQNFEVLPGNELKLYDYLDRSSDIAFGLSTNGVRVTSMAEQGTTLEDYFLQMVAQNSVGGNV